MNVTRQANPVEVAGPVAGEAEGETETTISVEKEVSEIIYGYNWQAK